MNHKSIYCFVLLAIYSFASPSAADLVVEIGNARADLGSDSGTTTATFDIIFRNPSLTDPVPIATYSLFLDIEPTGLELPTGVTFGTPAVTYTSGDGVGLLLGASKTGTTIFMPAAGDLGLGQLQFFNGRIDAGESFVMFQVNLLIDRAIAIPGDFEITLNSLGENSIESIGAGNLPEPQAFVFNAGSLAISAVPEPSVVAIWSLAGLTFVVKRRRN